MTTPVIRAALERLLNDLQCLILKSQGVSGLCRDGDLVTWPDLLKPGGCYSPWIRDAITAARDALAAADAGGGEALLAAPAAEGKAGELVAWLNNHAAHLRTMEGIGALPETELQERLDRAATLLQQQAAELAALRAGVVPVAVSERPWEREGWCDEQGRCWFLSSRFLTWSLASPPVTLTCQIARLHSLPSHAIPLPAPQGGEVEA